MAQRMTDPGMMGRMKNTLPPSMGKMFGRGSPETTPPDNSGKTPKSEAFYIHPPGTCGSCSHFIQGGDCELVDKSSEGFDSGTIDEGGYCCLYSGGEVVAKQPGELEEEAESMSLMEPSESVPEWEEYGVAA